MGSSFTLTHPQSRTRSSSHPRWLHQASVKAFGGRCPDASPEGPVRAAAPSSLIARPKNYREVTSRSYPEGRGFKSRPRYEAKTSGVPSVCQISAQLSYGFDSASTRRGSALLWSKRSFIPIVAPSRSQAPSFWSAFQRHNPRTLPHRRSKRLGEYDPDAVGLGVRIFTRHTRNVGWKLDGGTVFPGPQIGAQEINLLAVQRSAEGIGKR